jgi:hypothetical protein
MTCIESLEASQPGCAAQIIVADNGISEPLRRYWQTKGVNFVQTPSSPFIFSQAINMCAAIMGEGQDLLVLNDDTEMITPRWHDVAVTTLARIQLRRYGLLSFSISQKENVGNHDQALDKNLSPNGGVKESMKTICFIAALIRRTTWDKVGPMDERFVGYGFEDNDYNARVWNAGDRVGIISAVVVKHGKPQYPFSSSFARYNSMEKLSEMFGSNEKLMREKHSGGEL